jgi:hypothetical protein
MRKRKQEVIEDEVEQEEVEEQEVEKVFNPIERLTVNYSIT